jgi:U3 small nucleolar RNA-associated protein 24
VAKKIMSPKDTRVRENLEKAKQKEEALKKKAEPRQIEQANSSLFFQYNTQLGPPYHVLVDTNFINFSIRYVVNFRFCRKVTCFLNLIIFYYTEKSST